MTTQTVTSAVLVAAGASERFSSGNKLLHKLNGKELILHSADALLASEVEQLVIVTQPHDEKMIELLQQRFSQCAVTLLANPAHKSGMASSIRVGIHHCQQSANTIVALADMPHVQPPTLNALIRSAQTSEHLIFCPHSVKGRGNPILFKAALYPALMALEGDFGGKPLLKQFSDQIELVAVNDAGIYKDYDTLKDFEHQKS